MNFIEKCIAGEAKLDEIDDYVTAWHMHIDGEGLSLNTYLGMTWDEYSRWVVDPSCLDEIINNRKNKCLSTN